MRKLALLLSAAILLSTAASPPAEAEVSYAHEDFESGVAGIFNSLYGLDDTPDGHEGAGLYTEFGAGDVWGARSFWHFSQQGFTPPEEVYWRYWVRFDPNFYITPPLRGKLPGPATLGNDGCNGGTPTTPSNPCFSARTMFSRDYHGESLDGETLLGYYNYSIDSPSHRGDGFDWDPEVALIQFGDWHCVEGQLDLGTPGSADGTLRAWVDGDLAFDKIDIRYRRSGETFGIESFWFDVYYGKPSNPSPQQQGIWFDSWAMGTTRQGCDDAIPYDGSFKDDDSSPFENDIEWIASQGITVGCNPPENDRYCPTATVTRGQMAAFLDRALALEETSIDFFPDDQGTTFEASINRMAAAGITRGCLGGSSYCRDRPVTREQMAAFLHRALGGALTPEGLPAFDDTVDSIFRADIDWLSGTGITQGCNPPANSNFCPRQYVTRGQMAAFLHRALAP
jgi:hypothetical protein